MIILEPFCSFLDRNNRFFLMGIAIIWVFFYHLIFFYPNRDIPHILRLFIEYPNKGYLGVDIFFFLSSLGLCYSVKNNSLRVFFKNRFVRIIPLYVLFCIPVIILFKNCDATGDVLLLFLKQISGLSSIKVLSSGIEWYTPALMATYIMFPIIYSIMMRSKSSSVDLLIVFAFVMTVNFFRIYLENNFTPRFPIIIIGILTYKYLNEKKYTTLIIAYTLFIIMSFGSPNNITADSLLIPMTLLGISYLPIDSNLKKIVSFIGKYSYEIYLAQVITTLYILGQKRCLLPGLWQLFEVLLYTILISIIFCYSNKQLTKCLK